MILRYFKGPRRFTLYALTALFGSGLQMTRYSPDFGNSENDGGT